jgi:hypothetical protein
LRILQTNKDTFRFYAPSEADIVGLVPGRIGAPELREAKAPAVSMKDARRLRKNAGKPERKGKGGQESTEELLGYLREHGIDEEDLDTLWPTPDFVDELLVESVADFFVCMRDIDGSGHVGPSKRRAMLRDVMLFLENDVGLLQDYYGVEAEDKIIKQMVKQKKPKQQRTPAAPLYLPEKERPIPSSESRSSNKWSQFIDEEEEVQGENAEQGGGLYEPSSVWFGKPREEKMYEPSEMWFQEKNPPVQSREIDLVLDSPPRKSSAVADHVFKTPASRVKNRAADPVVLDLDVISPRMRQALAKVSCSEKGKARIIGWLFLNDPTQVSANPKRGLYFPPPPTTSSHGVATRALDCPVCSMSFSENLLLALHCMSKHWSVGEPEIVATSSLFAKPANVSPKPVNVSPRVNVSPKASPAFSNSPSMSVSMLSPSQFEVEAILERRVGPGGKNEYRVRWKGFGTDHITWEPEENMNCSQLIAEFLCREEEEKKKKEATVEKPKAKRKSKPAGGAAAFLDLEANLSGEGSSDEDEEGDENASGKSWIVDDDAVRRKTLVIRV